VIWSGFLVDEIVADFWRVFSQLMENVKEKLTFCLFERMWFSREWFCEVEKKCILYIRKYF